MSIFFLCSPLPVSCNCRCLNTGQQWSQESWDRIAKICGLRPALGLVYFLVFQLFLFNPAILDESSLAASGSECNWRFFQSSIILGAQTPFLTPPPFHMVSSSTPMSHMCYFLFISYTFIFISYKGNILAVTFCFHSQTPVGLQLQNPFESWCF